MAPLSSEPGSITASQRRAIFAVTQRHGLSVDDLRAAAGGSLARLSRRQASELIVRIGGGVLPHLPGQKPGTRRRPAPPAGVVRMITVEQIAQIARLMLDYFGSEIAAYDWLKRDFKARQIRDLASARRAGQVIGVLKTMIQRKVDGHGRPRRTAAN